MKCPGGGEGKVRIWSEHVSYPSLVRAEVLQPLRERSIQLLVAVWPHQVGELGAVVQACADHGVALGLWPMLDDAEGRWGNVYNAPAFRAHALRSADAALKSQPSARFDVMLDLEPPIDAVRRLLAARPLASLRRVQPSGRRGRAERLAPQALAQLVDDLEARALSPCRVEVPLLLLDAPGRPGWAEALGIAMEGPCSQTQVMLYTSLFQGYARGWVGRRTALGLLHELAHRALERHGQDVGVSVGVVGRGALGDERVYQSPAELAADVAVARAVGVRDVALHDLGGVLARGPIEPWLEALVDPGVPPESYSLGWRGASALKAGEWASRILAALS